MRLQHLWLLVVVGRGRKNPRPAKPQLCARGLSTVKKGVPPSPGQPPPWLKKKKLLGGRRKIFFFSSGEHKEPHPLSGGGSSPPREDVREENFFRGGEMFSPKLPFSLLGGPKKLVSFSRAPPIIFFGGANLYPPRGQKAPSFFWGEPFCGRDERPHFFPGKNPPRVEKFPPTG